MPDKAFYRHSGIHACPMSMLHVHVHAACPCQCCMSMSMLNVHVNIHVHLYRNAGMPDRPASGQSGTGLKNTNDARKGLHGTELCSHSPAFF
jgi:hypothetical protein